VTKLYREWLRERYQNDIEKVNKLYLQTEEKFSQLLTPYEDHSMHKWHPGADAKTDDWHTFKKTLPAQYIEVVSIDQPFGKFLRRGYETVEACNEDLGTRFPSLYDTRFEESPPENPRYRALWEEFVRQWCPIINLVVDSEKGQQGFEDFLEGKYGAPDAYNEIHNGNGITAFSDVRLTRLAPRKEFLAADWAEFVERAAPLSIIGFRTPDTMYREFLEQRYGDLDRLNQAYGTQHTSFGEISLPYKQADYTFFEANKGALRRGFLGVNYRAAFDFMVLHGRASANTLILIVALLATALTVNPMAAYALSRFNLSYTNRVLLFLLATMAFPAEVVMIPNFLLIKELHLLNTYWALILPAMANAYTIFILKGFFDSLPKELYEEAIINGASEGYMFLHITLPMSKPVMAVVALWTFLAGYGAYMWAFLICQNERMWTLMVYLFQFQMRNPPYAVMSAIALIAIPTLVVFVLTQRVILRGIITPSFT
jgi:multiple sugar transport system permease protein